LDAIIPLSKEPGDKMIINHAPETSVQCLVICQESSRRFNSYYDWEVSKQNSLQETKHILTIFTFTSNYEFK